jgi:HAD superfamily hydrolase (TIGR01509 family)
MHFEAILFDMDGVVIDTHHSVTEFWQILAAEHQIELTQADFQQHIYGCPMSHTFDILFPHFDDQHRQAIYARIHAYEINLTYTEIPGVTALLQALKWHGIPTALVTSADTWKVEVVLRQLGLTGLFTTQVTIGEIERGKPYPDGYLLAARRLQKPPERCLVFEDAISGVKAAIAAGAVCVGIQSQDIATALLAAGACYTVPDFTRINLQVNPGPNNGHQTSLCLQVGPELSLPLTSMTVVKAEREA